MSLREHLYNKIQTEGRVSYGAICQLTVELGYKVNTSERRLRELAEEGLISTEMAKSRRGTQYISAYLAGDRIPEQKKVLSPVFVERDGQVIVVMQ